MSRSQISSHHRFSSKDKCPHEEITQYMTYIHTYIHTYTRLVAMPHSNKLDFIHSNIEMRSA